MRRVVEESRAPADPARAIDPVEIEAEKQIDAVKGLVDDLSAKDLFKRFERLESALQQPLSARSRRRIGLNKGLCLLRMGDQEGAARTLLAAYEHDPGDAQAIAHKILGLWFLGETKEACAFGEIALACDPDNELAAFYLVQARADLPDGVDILADVPEVLRDKPLILTAEIAALRRGGAPAAWWVRARAAAALHPTDDELRALAAVAAVEEVTADGGVNATRTLGEAQTAALREAIEALDKAWRAARARLKDATERGVQHLAAAIVCARLLGDHGKVAEMLAVIDGDGLADPGLIATAARILETRQNPELFDRLTARASGHPLVAFQVGLELVQRGDTAEGARLLARADIPPEERAPVAVLQALEALAAGGGAVEAESLEALRPVAAGDPRALVLIAQSASDAGHADLAEDAYADALALAKASDSIAYRATVAARAHVLGRPSDVIDMLDGFEAARTDGRMLLMLARSHAAERPRRARNLRFFEGLPELADAQYEVACHRASVYAALDRPETVELARGLVGQRPDDAFAVALLAMALRAAGREAELPDVLRAIDLEALEGSTEHRFIAIHAFRRAGETARAMRHAYAIVVANPNDERAVTGYLGLHWAHLSERRDYDVFDEPGLVGPGCWVKLRSQLGTELTFIIGDEAQVPGTLVFAPAHALAAASTGLAVGDNFERADHLGLTARWTVEEFKSKYLFLWQHLLRDYNQRFPTSRAIMSIPMAENDFSPLETFMRNRNQVLSDALDKYLQNVLPLSMCARMVQQDPLSVAQAVRERGGSIRASVGWPEEQGQAWKVGRRARGRGAALDPYTAVVAARVGMLPPLRRYFGRLFTSTSTLRLLDGIIEHGATVPDEGLWQLSRSDGRLRSENTPAEVAARQCEMIARIRAEIVDQCTVETVLMPDDASPDLTRWNEVAGPRVMDCLSLAMLRSVPLLCDDQTFRELCNSITGVRGLWLHAALWLCLQNGDLDDVGFVRAAAGLARHRHGHALLSPTALRIAFDLGNEDDLSDFRALCWHIGGPGMDEESHAVFVARVWVSLWYATPPIDPLRVKRAFAAMLDHYTRGSSPRIPVLLWRLRCCLPSNDAFWEQILAWATGRFLFDADGSVIVRPTPLSAGRVAPPDSRPRLAGAA